MIGIKEHRRKIQEVSEQIKTAKGLHKKDLIRYRDKLKKQLVCAESYLKESNYGS